MTNRATKTAFGPMTMVVVEQHHGGEQRLVHDDVAHRFLPPSLKLVTRLARWRPLANLLIKAAEQTATGIWGSMLCRKRYIDDKNLEALRAGNEVVVILGAGLDTRAYRLPELVGVPVFELDLPENIDYKRKKVVESFGEVPAHVHLVPIDFEAQDLGSVLAEHGYEPERKTFFVWEGVTQYLSEAGVRDTLRFLAQAAPGSRLVFTYLRKDFLDGDELYGARAAYQRFKIEEKVWKFALGPADVPPLLAQYGWSELEQMGPHELTEHYVEPLGRTLAVSEIERTVYAEKS
jgi:methyltransferase (TIGR00027 family)